MTQPIHHRLVISTANLGNNSGKSNKMMHYFTKNNIEGGKVSRKSISYTKDFSVKGCQVDKMPMYTGVCNLFEVVRGCQRLSEDFWTSKASQGQSRQSVLCVLSVQNHMFS